MSSHRGLAVDEDNLYVTQSDGVVVALRQRDGSELWRNQKMKLRRLSAPVLTSTAVVVADFEGYLHWMDKTTGELVARERIAKERVSSPPVAVDDTVVVLTDRGKLAAYRATPAAMPAPAATVAAPATSATSAAPAVPAEAAPAAPPPAAPVPESSKPAADPASPPPTP
jgi:outer membrane protein assembly factor BamB